MIIRWNGDEMAVAAQDSLASLIIAQGYQDRVCAFAVNGSFVPKALHTTTFLNEHDVVQVVMPMQGG